MKVFTVHEQPDPPADRLDRAEALEFVKDGFSLGAALLPPVWMIGNGLWLALCGYAAIGLLLPWLLSLLGVPGVIIGLYIAGLHLAIGFEASSIRRWALERQGWTMLGSVTGASLADCERRFLDTWLADAGARSFREGRLDASSGPGSRSGGRGWWRFGSARGSS